MGKVLNRHCQRYTNGTRAHKTCSTSLVTREMQIKTKMRYHYKLTKMSKIKKTDRASLVAQWLGVCLPMRGTRVRALVWGDPTCRGAAGPVSHDC